MVVNATGYLTTPLKGASLAHADSAAWRTWGTFADQAAALVNIHFHRAAVGYLHPVIVLSFEEGYRADESDEEGYDTSGGIECIFQDTVNPLLDEKEAYYEFGNNVSEVTVDVLEKSKVAGYVKISGIDFGIGPQRPDKNKKKTLAKGDFFQWIIVYETEGIVQ